MRNDESREDEEEINAEIAAGKERQKRIETGWYILLGVHPQHQQGRERPDAGQSRHILRSVGWVFGSHALRLAEAGANKIGRMRRRRRHIDPATARVRA